jgi:hypothetical protein
MRFTSAVAAPYHGGRQSRITTSNSILGRFELLRDLGTGGMAEVWLARDTSSGEHVALKRLRRDAAKANAPSRLALFEREYHMLAQLSHPHIVRVHDYGVEEGGAFYTMEVLEGGDLRDRGLVPWRELCEIVRDIAAALALVHSRRLLHRDLTLRNVRFTADGRPKLIDFGALTPMGMSREVIGTPPFVPPELLNGMALDGRSDLYALGALMYVALSGRHAYPARNLKELRDRWRTRPLDIATLVSDLPPAMAALVMSLLSLDETARPRSASEVIERVSASAGRQRTDDVDFGRAFLTAPKLVGRDDAIATIRRHVLQARARRGTTLLIEGEPGAGRTRLLERCALEGRLAGAMVLRAFASDAGRGDYGVLQALAQDLLMSAPEVALQLAEPHAAWLVHALPEVSRRLGLLPAGADLDGATLRQRVQQAVLDWLSLVSRRKHVVILVDDLHHCDEPSAAVLAGLARRTSALPLNVITTLPLGADGPLPQAVQLLANHSARIKLRPLPVADFTALLRSVFGDVAGMAALAEHLHGLCAGNPRACMGFAEHLVDAGLVRYDRGAWVLPASLDGVVLPKAVRTPHERQLLDLGEDERELCEALALSDAGLPLAAYGRLTSHGDPARLHAALARLVAAAVLASSNDSYAFAHPGLPAVIRARMEPDAAERAHARLYRAHVELGAEPMRLAYHALYGGDPARAARLVIEFWKERLDSDQAAELDWPAHMRETIEPLVAYCEREGWSPLDVFVLRQVLVLATMWTDPGYALEQGRALDPILRHDIGLTYWDEVEGSSTLERVGRCFELAQARYDATPEKDRGLAPLVALQRLGRHVLYGTQCASFAHHSARLRELVDLIAPLAPVAPALELIDLLARAALVTLHGLSDQGAAMLEQVLHRLEQPDVGLPPSHLRLFRLGVLYGLGLVRCKFLDPRLLQWADELETHALHQPNAWRLRKLHHLHQPNLVESARCQERIEMLALQLNRGFWGNTAFIEVWSSGAYGDFQGVKQGLAVIESLAERFASQNPSRDFARGLHHLLSGDAAAAEPLFGRVYDACVELGDYFRISLAQDYRALALIALGRPADAKSALLQMRERMPSGWLYDYRTEILLALCDAEQGEPEAARVRVTAGLTELKARDMFGPHRIMPLECAARVALRIEDRELFERCARELATFFVDGHCPSLRARQAALVKEAQQRGLRLTDHGILGALDVQGDHASPEYAQSVREALDRCAGPAERSARALSLICERGRAPGGFLYALKAAAEISLIACSPGYVPTPGIVQMLRSRVEAITRSRDELTGQLDETTHEEESGLLTDADGTYYQVAFLGGGTDGSELPTALAVLRLDGAQPRVIAYDLLQSIGQALFEAGDFTALA